MSTSKPVDVKVEQGILRGQTIVSEDGITYDAFRGIPYAQKPVGRLRFKAPRPPEPWEGTRLALEEGSKAPQFDHSGSVIGNEDCLYLNVYTPHVPSSVAANPPESLRPIMVWLHPGAFRSGSGSSEDFSPELFMEKDVVVVTLNYRLGALGFLSLESPAATGNYGLKDVVAAFRWVKANGGAFGGDTECITVFGCSAGGSFSQLLQVSPMAKGLIHRAISQSGPSIPQWLVRTEPRDRATRLARQLGASGSELKDDHTILEFLRAQSPEDIVKASKTIIAQEEMDNEVPMVFGPVCEQNLTPEDPQDEVFLPARPRELLTKNRVNDIPVIMGVADKEGLILNLFYPAEAHTVQATPEVLAKFDRRLELVLPKELRAILPEKKQKEIAERLRKIFFGGGAVCEDSIDSYYDLHSDLWFTTAILHEARILARNSTKPVFVYRFNVRGKINRISQVLGVTPENSIGACHGDELSYLWNTAPPAPPVPKLDPHSLEARTRQRIVTLWTNFAKTGNPTPEGQTVEGVHWPQLPNDVGSSIPYLDFGADLTTPDTGIYQERVEFWEWVYSQQK